MNDYKYVLNKGTKRLHLINGCCHSKYVLKISNTLF